MSTRNGGPRQTVERFLAAVASPAPGDMADCKGLSGPPCRLWPAGRAE